MPLASTPPFADHRTRCSEAPWVQLSGDDQMLLPLGRRPYSAELDLSGIEPGYYAVRAVFGIGEGKDVTRQQVVRVDVQETKGSDGKVVTIPVVTVDPNAPEIAVETGEGGGPPTITLDGGSAAGSEAN